MGGGEEGESEREGWGGAGERTRRRVRKHTQERGIVVLLFWLCEAHFRKGWERGRPII